MGLAEAKNNFSRVTAEVNRTGKPVTILKNNRPWVVIQPAQQSESAVDVAVDFMDAYADVFEELAKRALSRFLRMCGVGFTPDHAEFLSAMLGVADGSMSYEQLVDWVRINAG